MTTACNERNANNPTQNASTDVAETDPEQNDAAVLPPDGELDVVSPEDAATTWPDPTYGLSTHSLEHDDMAREYLLYVPQSYTGEVAVPVLLSFHGGGGDATGHLEWVSDMRDLSETEGFILVYPEGSLLDSGDAHWNPIPPSPESKSNTDDFGFVEAMLNAIGEEHNMDTTRVYATGYSNGAGMAYGLLCYQSDLIAAAAPVSGSMYFQMSEECNATHPTSIAIFNGTEDGARPYEGLPGWFMPVEEAVAFWVDFNSIAADPVVESFDTNGVTVERRLYEGGDGGAGVALFKVIGGGHDWFNMDIEGANIDELIWDFLSRYDMNGLR